MTNKIHPYEIDELALVICGLQDSDAAHEDPSDVAERAVYERYDCDIETFAKIAEDLLPLVTVARAGASGTLSYGFAHDKCFIVKRAIDEEAEKAS